MINLVIGQINACDETFLRFLLFCLRREQLGAVERGRQKYKAASLTVEFVPFFYRKYLQQTVT